MDISLREGDSKIGSCKCDVAPAVGDYLTYKGMFYLLERRLFEMYEFADYHGKSVHVTLWVRGEHTIIE